jgi:hypothetical protein
MLKKRKKRMTDFQFRETCKYLVENEIAKEMEPKRPFIDVLTAIFDRFTSNLDTVETILDINSPIPPELKSKLQQQSKEGK